MSNIEKLELNNSFIDIIMVNIIGCDVKIIYSLNDNYNFKRCKTI